MVMYEHKFTGNKRRFPSGFSGTGGSYTVRLFLSDRRDINVRELPETGVLFCLSQFRLL